jgi:deoxyadenosine/deoxycytidine kinase
MNASNGMIVSVEGNIGAGKSTLLEHLRTEYPDAYIVPEPVDEWSTVRDSFGVTILEKYYEDPSKYAFSFQMMAFITRIKLLKAAPKDRLVITERSVFTDRKIFAKMLHDSGKIDDIEYAIYLKWFDELVGDLKIDTIVYLKTSHLTCFSRIKQRNRPGEHIPPSYIADCHYYHEEWLGKTSVPTLVLNGDLDFSEWKLDIHNFLECV